VGTTSVIVTAGLAEIAAGSIAMGLGGYLAAQSDAEHYDRERVREQGEVRETPNTEAEEVAAVLRSYGLTDEESQPIVDALRKRPEAWVNFMILFELDLEKSYSRRAIISAATIAGAYIVGGFIPLGPSMFLSTASTALPLSAIVTLIVLAVFGYIKSRFTGTAPRRSAIQTVLIGGIAATGAFLIARAIS
jgi:vacuolar iron transporter family protein